MSDLKQKVCVACEGGIPALTPAQAKDMMSNVPGWTLSEDSTKIYREFTFKDFEKALAFVNEVGKLAQEDWHHPDIEFGWGRVKVTFTTHSVNGVTENDFIVAAKINLL